LTIGVGDERLKSIESVPIVPHESMSGRAIVPETNAPGFEVLIGELRMKSRKMVLVYHDNQLKALYVPGLPEKLVHEYPPLRFELQSFGMISIERSFRASMVLLWFPKDKGRPKRFTRTTSSTGSFS